MAFQIWDDIRDLVVRRGAPRQAGRATTWSKAPTPSRSSGPWPMPGVGDDLRALLGGPLDAPARDKARDLVLSTPAVHPRRVREARRWAERADSALDVAAGRAAGCAEHLDVMGQVGTG